MENVEIGRHCRIRKAIIDKDVTIPPETAIGYNLEEDRKRYHVTPSGIVVIAKGTEVSGDVRAAAIAKEKA
jgi:glucose-1-phosphate adenylyltransferase